MYHCNVMIAADRLMTTYIMIRNTRIIKLTWRTVCLAAGLHHLAIVLSEREL